ncbi:MAG: HK97 family phage prohead protease [Oricola sp.]|nr:MAG: HK97 family phage prohead protease [Oricola sp.]
MLWGAVSGALELRATDGGVRVSGRFPYNSETELAPGRAEIVASEAFQWDDDALFLFQHDMARPLASIRAGSLNLRNSADALEFEAHVDGGTSWGRDFEAALRSNLVTGLSPGFRVARGGERVERRGDGVVRTITRAELVELSAVTRPAFPSAQVESRNWQAAHEAPDAGLRRALARWRA